MRIKNKNEYLNKILEISNAPIFVSKLSFKKQDDKYTPGVRVPFLGGKAYNIKDNIDFDDRTVTPFEIIFDIDTPSYKKVLIIAKAINDVCEISKIPIYWFATGGKGLHGHIFFNLKLNDNETKILKEAMKYGFNDKHIRLWFFNYIKDMLNMPKQVLDLLDDKPIKFSYMEGTTHLIRACGGRKAIYDNFSKETQFFYKSYINPIEFKKHLEKYSKKIKISNPEEVIFPDIINQYLINTEEDGFIEYLHNYISSMSSIKFKEPITKMEGKYLDLHGVKQILNGLTEGNRSTGARIIATACKKDDLSKQEAIEILKGYVERCTGKQPYTLFEAQNWLDWVYRLPLVYWNCSFLDELGLHDREKCMFCKSKNKKHMNILKDPNILNKIKEFMDEYIVGESTTKMLIFLLMLSSNFPSKTGAPGWNVPSDPQSQNIILAADSASGKSYVAKGVLELFGEEDNDYFIISRISSSSFNYIEENMDGKIFFIEEMQGLNDENTTQLRVWMSEGKLTLTSVEKVKNSEGIEVNAKITKTTKGCPCFVTCQAEGIIGEQLLNRSWIIGMDVSTKQTSDILDYQCKINASALSKNVQNKDIKEALKLLTPRHYIIDFIDWRKLNIPANDVRTRRDFIKFLTLIKCVTYLHQYQREIVTNDDGVEFIKSTYKDYDIALRYAQDILGATFSGLTLDQISLLNMLKIDHSPDDDLNKYFTINDIIRKYPNKSHTHWRAQLNHLCNTGFVLIEEDNGYNKTYILNKDKVFKVINLPTSEELKKINEGQIIEVKDDATKENILEFMATYNGHLIPWSTLKNKFDNIESILKILLHNGDIFEAKPGMFMLL